MAATITIICAYDPASVNNQDWLTSEVTARTANGSSHNNLLVPFTFAHTSDAVQLGRRSNDIRLGSRRPLTQFGTAFTAGYRIDGLLRTLTQYDLLNVR